MRNFDIFSCEPRTEVLPQQTSRADSLNGGFAMPMLGVLEALTWGTSMPATLSDEATEIDDEIVDFQQPIVHASVVLAQSDKCSLLSAHALL